MKTRLIATLAAAMAAACGASAAPAVKSSFAAPPADAVKYLKATVGKPFSAGYVFVDGKYVKPPYKVERYGNVIRINGIQVTDQVVSWDEFLKTQAGVTVTKTETPAEPAPAEPEPEPEEVEDYDDDSSASLDDLFDDNPAPKKPKKAKRKAAPRPRKPTTTVTYSMEGDFVPNEKSKSLVEKINTARTRIDSQLRSGGYFCFGSRYATVSGNASTTKLVLGKLPDAMKKGTTRDAFGTAMRQAGLTFFPLALTDDLFRNRFDYLQLAERIKSDQEQSKWSQLLGPSM